MTFYEISMFYLLQDFSMLGSSQCHFPCRYGEWPQVLGFWRLLCANKAAELNIPCSDSARDFKGSIAGMIVLRSLVSNGTNISDICKIRWFTTFGWWFQICYNRCIYVYMYSVCIHVYVHSLIFMVWLAQPRARPRVGAEKQFTLLAEKQLLGGQDGQLHQGAEWIIATPETQDSKLVKPLYMILYGFTLFSWFTLVSHR